MLGVAPQVRPVIPAPLAFRVGRLLDLDREALHLRCGSSEGRVRNGRFGDDEDLLQRGRLEDLLRLRVGGMERDPGLEGLPDRLVRAELLEFTVDLGPDLPDRLPLRIGFPLRGLRPQGQVDALFPRAGQIAPDFLCRVAESLCYGFRGARHRLVQQGFHR